MCELDGSDGNNLVSSVWRGAVPFVGILITEVGTLGQVFVFFMVVIVTRNVLVIFLILQVLISVFLYADFSWVPPIIFLRILVRSTVVVETFDPWERVVLRGFLGGHRSGVGSV
jgi:hypothetical protein